MNDATLPAELKHWAELIERLRWAAFILDQDHRLVWASPDTQRLLGSPPQEELGYGMHVLHALTTDTWRRVATSDSAIDLLSDLAPLVTKDAEHQRAIVQAVPEEFREVLGAVEPRPFTRPIATSVDYIEPLGERDLPVMRVNLLVMPLPDENRSFLGTLILGFIGLRPALVSLLARGDETMYERMAKLVEPQSHEGAILFCDLQGSTDLARRLPTSEYFRLIRSLWTEIDALVANNGGIIGKHAGDGASAFFLVHDLGSASDAVSAAIRTARAIHDRSEDIFATGLERSCLMRIGVHWGSSLYLGQLVPGGRLDVTALGDAVNECARIQDCADPHQTLASKQLIEQLSADDAAALGVVSDKLRYSPLSEIKNITDQALAVAGAIPVAAL
jgi:class 3 adenylate cyclase